jgi:hypothetical protein
MRILMSAALLCALAAPSCALTVAQSGLSAPAPLVQVKGKGKGKPAKAAKAKGGKCAPGAICPLVGGGDY